MARTVVGERVSFKRDGDDIGAYVARPEGDDARPGLVIIPDVHGLSEHYRDVARRFAAAGYVASALDPYSREGTPQLADLEAVFRWMNELPDERVLADIAAAVAYLSGHANVHGNPIGITGFCMGGQYTLMSACTVDGIAAAVSWYGMLRYREATDIKPKSPLDLAPHMKCPYLGLFGAEDPIIPVADVEELRVILEREKKTFEIEIYAGAGHAFHNDTRPEMYREQVARTAWQRALKFFESHMAPAKEKASTRRHKGVARDA